MTNWKVTDCNADDEMNDKRCVPNIIILSTNITRHRASTSMYSLTFRVRVMLP